MSTPSRRKIIKKTKKTTDGLSACQKADVDCILMANILGEVLCFTFSPVPRGKKKKTHSKEDKERQKKRLSEKEAKQSMCSQLRTSIER